MSFAAPRRPFTAFTVPEMRAVLGGLDGVCPKKGHTNCITDAMSSDSLDPAGVILDAKRKGLRTRMKKELEENCRRITADLVRERPLSSTWMGANNETEFEIKSPKRRKTARTKRVRAGNRADAGLVQNSGWLREFKESERRARGVEGRSLLQFCKHYSLYYPGLRDRVLNETGETRRH